MIELIDIVSVRPLAGYRLEITFSDGRTGEHDFHALVEAGGGVVEALRDPTMFSRVYVELGALAWPSGFDLDPTELHRQMESDGELRRNAA